MHDKPVVVLDPAGHYDELWAYVERLRIAGFVRTDALDRLARVATVEDAFRVIETSAPR